MNINKWLEKSKFVYLADGRPATGALQEQAQEQAQERWIF